MSNNVNPIVKVGGESKVPISNVGAEELLMEVLGQLKIINLQLSVMTDEEFITNDIEDER